MEKLLVKAKGGPMTLHSGFRSFANDRNGTISQSGFARALEHYGVVLRPEELSVRVPPLFSAPLCRFRKHGAFTRRSPSHLSSAYPVE
jgi:hypothetical protein